MPSTHERRDYTVTVQRAHSPYKRSESFTTIKRAREVAQQFANDGYNVEIVEHVGDQRTIAVFPNTWRP